jgi:hypothetical protein
MTDYAFVVIQARTRGMVSPVKIEPSLNYLYVQVASPSAPACFA